MDRIRVLFALDSPMFGDLLRERLQRESDLEVVGQVTEPVDLLLMVAETQADVVIHSWPDASEVPGICTQLLVEYPNLLVIGFPREEGFAIACQQTITTTPIPEPGVDDLLDKIRSLVTT